MRFPRPCRFVARRFIFACQFAIGEALAADLGHGESETLPIVHVFARIETEGLLVKVTVKMERLYRNIRARDAALQETPEVLKAVCVTRPSTYCTAWSTTLCAYSLASPS